MLSKRLIRSRMKVCPYKEKLDLINAQEYLLAAQKDTSGRYKDPKNLELYLCPCGFLHIGHKLGTKQTRA